MVFLRTTIWSSLIALTITGMVLAQQPNYNVNFGTPDIDGTYDPQEWAGAANPVGSDGEEGSGWTIRQTGAPDPWNFTFQALYDEDNIYLLGRSNYEGVAGVDSGRGWDGFKSTWNIYFDPNIIDDDLDPNNQTTNDGYQVAFRSNDTSSLDGDIQFWPAPEGVDNTFFPGVFIEAHTNTPWGNNSGEWSNFEDMQIFARGREEGAVNDDGDSIFFEMMIPWSNFDAAEDFIPVGGELQTDFGLYAPQTPEPNSVWNFTAAWIPESEGTLPSWHNQTEGAFAVTPHGTLTFMAPPVGGADCDFDGDEDCDIVDLDNLMYVGLANNDLTYDIDESGTVDLADRDAWLIETGSLPGDANLDGKVDSVDLNSVGVNWQNPDGPTDTWANGDFTGDGNVNSVDLNVIGVNWQKSASDFPGVPAAAVPEPTGLAVVLAGLLGLLAFRRR